MLQTPTRATLVPARDESVNFDETQNLFIEGDNLEVLKLLYKPYFGRVKMIYIDPPYNTGNDFIYPDNYTDPLAAYLQLTGQQDATGNLLTSNTETERALSFGLAFDDVSTPVPCTPTATGRWCDFR